MPTLNNGKKKESHAEAELRRDLKKVSFENKDSNSKKGRFQFWKWKPSLMIKWLILILKKTKSKLDDKMQARHQLKQYEGRIKNIEEEHKQVTFEEMRKIQKNYEKPVGTDCAN